MPLIRKPTVTTPKESPSAHDMLQALASDNVEQRWTAARMAADVAGGAEALAAALPIETDARVREAMLTSLSRIGSPQSVNAIVPLLRSDDANLRAGALDALSAMVGTYREFLPALLRDSDNDVRILSCELVRGLPSADATSLLCNLLVQEQDPNVCAAAIDVLAEVGGIEALPVLAQCENRFSATPFLGFAIKIATDRIVSQSKTRHV